MILKKKNTCNGNLLMFYENVFAYSFVSEHSDILFYFEKKLAFLAAGGVDPPPLAEVLPYSNYK